MTISAAEYNLPFDAFWETLASDNLVSKINEPEIRNGDLLVTRGYKDNRKILVGINVVDHLIRHEEDGSFASTSAYKEVIKFAHLPNWKDFLTSEVAHLAFLKRFDYLVEEVHYLEDVKENDAIVIYEGYGFPLRIQVIDDPDVKAIHASRWKDRDGKDISLTLPITRLRK